MATATSLPIARLRSLGCKVNTVIGHDPNIADFIYSVRLPEGIDLTESAGQAPAEGPGVIEVPRHSDGRVIVKACSYRVGQTIPSRAVRDRNAAAVAALLTAIADAVEEA